MQMSLVLVVRGLLGCVIENAKDCLASECQGMLQLAANQNGPPHAVHPESLPRSPELNRFILINCAESIQVRASANFFHQSLRFQCAHGKKSVFPLFNKYFWAD